MFSRILIAMIGVLVLSPSIACSSIFDLTWHQDDEFILSPTASSEGAVYVYLEGAKDMNLEEVIDLTCGHGTYTVPVIKAQVDTGVSSATRFEYFIYDVEDSKYLPLKSMLSVYAVDRETDDTISDHVIPAGSDTRQTKICEYVPQDNEFDRPVLRVSSEGHAN